MVIYSKSGESKHSTRAELDKADEIDYDALSEFETAERIRREKEKDGLCDECTKTRRSEHEESEE